MELMAEDAVIISNAEPGAEDESRALFELDVDGGAETSHRVQQRILDDDPHGHCQMSVFCTGKVLRGYPEREVRGLDRREPRTLKVAREFR